MAPYNTAYLVIPKKKVSRIITADVQNLKIYTENEEEIKLGYNKGRYTAKKNWRVSLYDYKFEAEKVETPDGSVETGVLGTKLNYHSDKGTGSSAKQAVSEYIETG